MAAPTVQSLQDIIGQITAAQQPQYQQIDSNINSNEQTGQGQVAGLNSAKDQAFGKIEQAASNKGMYFSGFSPNAQAGYTGSTYLPALAKLQNTIAATRQTLLGQKANLQTTANTQGINIHDSQQKALDAYNMEMQREAQAAAEAEKQRQFTAAENARDRSSRASIARAGAAPAQNSAATNKALRSQEYSAIGSKIQQYRQAGKNYGQTVYDLQQSGYNPGQFDQLLRQAFVSQNYSPTAQQKEQANYVAGG